MEVTVSACCREASVQFGQIVHSSNNSRAHSPSILSLRVQPLISKRGIANAHAALGLQARQRSLSLVRQCSSTLSLGSVSSSHLARRFGVGGLRQNKVLRCGSVSADTNVESQQDHQEVLSEANPSKGEDKDENYQGKATQEAAGTAGGKTFYLFEKEKASTFAQQGDGGQKPRRQTIGGRPATIKSWLGDDNADSFAGWSNPPSSDGRKGGRFRGLPETAAALVLAIAVAGVSYRVVNRSGPLPAASAPIPTTTVLPSRSNPPETADTSENTSASTSEEAPESLLAESPATPTAPPPLPLLIPEPPLPEGSMASPHTAEQAVLESKQPLASDTEKSVSTLPSAEILREKEDGADDMMGQELTFPSIVLPWSPEAEDDEPSQVESRGNVPSFFSSLGELPAVSKPPPTPATPPSLSMEEPEIVPEAVPVLGKVVVPPAVDPIQQQAFAALQSIQVVEPNAEASGICTRREYARWLVAASNLLNKSCSSRVFPAMFIEGASELAFDDVQPDDHDFAHIQGLAEAGLIPSRLSRADLKCEREPPKPGCSAMFGGAFFRPDSPLTREDLIAWKVALEHVYLPDPDVKTLEQNWGLIDIDRIDRDALRAVALDLTAGDSSAFAAAFGYTRRLQPNKPVTRAQVASALSAGDMREAVVGELERMEAERLAEAAIEQVFAAEERADRELSEQKYVEDADLRRRREEAQKLTDQVKSELEAARQELEVARREREEERRRRALELASEREVVVRERAAAEAERETLLRDRLEVEQRIATLTAARLEAEAGCDRAEKLKIEAESARQDALRMREAAESERKSTAQARIDAEAERRALSLARSWAEDEAKKARAQATKLEMARQRWEASGLEVNVDEDQQKEEEAGKLAGPTWEFAGRDSPTTSQADPLGFMIQRVMKKGEELKRSVSEKGVEIGRNVREKGGEIKRNVGQSVEVKAKEVREGMEVVGGGVRGTVASGIDGAKRAADALKRKASELVGRLNVGGVGSDGTASAAGGDSQ